MVAAQQEKIFRVFNLVGEQKTDRLKWLFAAIHVVAQEQIVWLGGETPVLEKAK